MADKAIAETWGGFLFVVMATAVAVIIGVPLVNKATQAVFKKSPGQLLSFGKAA
jgi:hypothetical protein